MRRTIAGLAIILLGCLGCLHTPMPWSPDGAWIAYTVDVAPADQILAPGWIFEPGPPPARPAAFAAAGYRLWATRAATNTSVLLEDSPTPLTAPGWSPDGHALAFGRVVTDADRSSRFEVIILEGLARRRVVASRPLAALEAEVSRLAFQAVAWSPDGRYLAIPQLEPSGLAIIRADNGRTVNTIPDAFLPSWSPTGGRLAFYIRSGGHSLHFIESALGQPRPLLEVGQASQAPIWSRDGSSLVATRRSNPRGGEATDQVNLVRVRIDNGSIESIRSLSADIGPNRDRPIEGTSIAFDRDAENLFCATALDGQGTPITWYHPRNNEVFKKFWMVDPTVPVGSLSFAPDGKTLAARVAIGEHLAAPVLCEPEATDQKARLVAPDDASRLDWIATLVRSGQTILASFPGPGPLPGRKPTPAIGRPTILPLLTDFPPNADALPRLRRIGRLGRPLCDRPADAPELIPTTRRVFDEARLFFDYLREDYSAALDDLRTLEADATTPGRRLALLTIRAQILINQGQFGAAKRAIGFLEAIDRPVARRVEWSGGRYVLTPEPRPDQGWPRHLAQSLAQLQNSLGDAKPVDPASNFIPGRASELFRPQAPARVNPLVPQEAGDQQVPFRPFAPRVGIPRAGGTDRPRQ